MKMTPEFLFPPDQAYRKKTIPEGFRSYINLRGILHIDTQAEM